MPAHFHPRRVAAVGLIATATLLTACASANAPSPFERVSPEAEGLGITVVNDHVMDMRIYLLRGTVPIPVGSVGSAERRDFRLSPSELGHMGDIRLMAEPVGGLEQPYLSEVIQVAPGQRLEWHLAHRLSLSSVTIRW